MLRRFFLPLCLLLTSIACGENAAEESRFSETEMTSQQQAYDQMMTIHDTIMVKMGEINQASRALRTVMESDTLPQERREQFLAALAGLEAAEDSMMEWMSQLRILDSLRTNREHTAIMTYLQDETTAIQQVDQAMQNSIGNARSLLGGQ